VLSLNTVKFREMLRRLASCFLPRGVVDSIEWEKQLKQIIRQAAPHVMATEPRRRSERIRAQSSSVEDEARLSQVRAAITKNASFFSDTHDDVDSIRVRQPTEVPEFTIGTLRRAIPAHCFERRCVFEPPLPSSLLSPPLLSPLLPSLALCVRSPSLLRSFAYLVVDLLLVALLFVFSSRIDALAPVVTRAFPVLPVWLVKAAMWTAYWFFQGAVATGMWTIRLPSHSFPLAGSLAPLAHSHHSCKPRSVGHRARMWASGLLQIPGCQ
jgi:hypothetical protein